jgi:SAM-dependent methyltransferase
MKLNRIEFALMNNPLRAVIQERYEVRALRRMSHAGPIDRALEIECGNGNGTRLIRKYFAPAALVAIALDERMSEIARKRNRDATVAFKVMDASKLEFPDGHFDAVFDFGIMYYLSHSVEASPGDIQKGRVTVTRTETGQPFDWRTLFEGLHQIKTEASRPVEATIAVRYRGHWFYIDDSDLDSKSTCLPCCPRYSPIRRERRKALFRC